MALNASFLHEPYFHPPLTDSDYRTASRGASRRTSRRGSISPMSSTPVLPGDDFGDNKEEISVLDPRRLTPTLHANLVSEILSLRREIESKNNLVSNLEENLAATKDENSKLQENLARHARENQSVRRQMDTLEGGTLSAIEDLAKERDKAMNSLSDVKQRLETSQKKVRAQQEDVERTQTIYERDKEKWEVEKRILERKVHVVEGRLKTVLTEVESVQNSSQQRTASHETPRSSYSRDRPVSRASGARSAASRHRESNATNDGEIKHFRFSNVSAPGPGSKTLADELQFDDDSDLGSDGGYMSPEALPEERPRPFSVQSHRQSIKARKLLGLAVAGEDEEENEISNAVAQDAPSQFAETFEARGMQPPAYVDSSTQYSLSHLSPEIEAQRLSTITELDEAASEKRNSRGLLQGVDSVLMPGSPIPVAMVSSACQTNEPPLSPPETPTKDKRSASNVPKVEMVTASTQTVQYSPQYSSPATTRENVSVATEVPTIAIHPVQSDSARNSIVLPPNTKNASCQAAISTSTHSVSVQTEGIRIDERLERLPEHLHPSVILPYSPASSPSPEAKRTSTSQSSVKRSSLQIPQRSRPTSLRRSITKDQVFSKVSADDRGLSGDDDGHVSDDSFLQKEPIKKTLSKVQNSWRLVSQTDDEAGDDSDTEVLPRKHITEQNRSKRRSDLAARGQKSPQRKFEQRSGKVLQPIVTERPNDFKRSALISSGAAAHAQRGRSPSEPARPERLSGQIPPFPVPDRSSSRKLPWSPSDGSGSPTSRNSRDKAQRQSRPPSKRPTMRKSRSTVGRSHRAEDRSRSRSPPPFHDFAESLSSIPPPLPENEITSPYTPPTRPQDLSHLRHKSVNSAAESAVSDQTSVVDAIAQTMIGEWMWKYVRRRKSFGIPESNGNEYDSSQGKDGMMTGGMRHQRWVWVAPYERAVMWSSKQPTSGSALMGKSGRKLTITSVLDVRDDTPMPKGAPNTSIFGRSILILTPQRALKFTASSIERHYVWLSALSFLSHTAIEVTDVGLVQTTKALMPVNETQPPSAINFRQVSQPTVPTLRRGRIQDSIRVAKGKDRPIGAKRAFTSPSSTTLHEVQNAVPSEIEDRGAEAPHVPRRTADTRRRSNTGPKSKPTNSLRSFSSSQKPSLHSMRSRCDSSGELPLPPAMNAAHSRTSSQAEGSHPGDRSNGGLDSIGKKRPEWKGTPETSNSYDAANGTVRMQAFVSDHATHSSGRRPAGVASNSQRGPPIGVNTSDSRPMGSNTGSTSDAARPRGNSGFVSSPLTMNPPNEKLTHANTFPSSAAQGAAPTTVAPTPTPAGPPQANTSAKREGRPSGLRTRSDGQHPPFNATGPNYHNSSVQPKPMNGPGQRPPYIPFAPGMANGGTGSGMNSPISPVSVASTSGSGTGGRPWGAGGKDPFEGFDSSGPAGFMVENGGFKRVGGPDNGGVGGERRDRSAGYGEVKERDFAFG